MPEGYLDQALQSQAQTEAAENSPSDEFLDRRTDIADRPSNMVRQQQRPQERDFKAIASALAGY
jgi:hypothetical protein